MSARPRVAIAHDYLTQRGGAERVVLAMAAAFPDARIYTTLYNPEGTYPEFADHDIVTSPLNRISALRRDHRKALPFLAAAASGMSVDADVVISSSSGWAHGFGHSGKSIVYCHAPARWIYQSEAYLGGSPTSSPTGLALLAMRPALREWDRRAARANDRYLCNSRVVKERIREAYNIDATVLPAPHGMKPDAEQQPVAALEDWQDDGWLLVVSRLLPYKNVDVVIDAVRGGDQRLVVVGAGPGREHILATNPDNVRLVSDLSDAQVRWVYAHARLLIGPSLEDYGLTPLEAAAFGVPSLTLRAGGYLDTVVEGVTGQHVDAPDASLFRDGIAAAAAHQWNRSELTNHAQHFSPTSFGARLHEEVRAILAQ